MNKYIFLPLLLLAIKTAMAQTLPVTYYVDRYGRQVSTKDSAWSYMVFSPCDTPADKKGYYLRLYDKDGQLRSSGHTYKLGIPPVAEGADTTFSNGKIRMIANLVHGKAEGEITSYYPNGQIYNKRRLSDGPNGTRRVLFLTCYDSTGKVLAENGNGYWINYDQNFAKINSQGKVIAGLQDSVWTNADPDGKAYTTEYRNGQIVSGGRITSVEIEPTFPGGSDAFAHFIASHIKYPDGARLNDIHGRVIVSFVVEKDGSLTDIKVVRGIGGGCDEEAVRVIKLSPNWNPGIQNGHPVRVAYVVPINFSSK